MTVVWIIGTACVVILSLIIGLIAYIDRQEKKGGICGGIKGNDGKRNEENPFSDCSN